jgi:hypothetical protein
MIKVTLICTTSYEHFNHDKRIPVYSSPVVYGIWNINIVLILRSWRVDKKLPEIYRLFVSTDFVGVLKMLFGELKSFFSNCANWISMVHTKYFWGLEGSKCLFHLKYELHSWSIYLFQKLSHPKFTNLLRSSRSRACLVSEIQTCS